MLTETEKALISLIRFGLPFSDDPVVISSISREEWGDIFQVALKHRLAPLLYASLLRREKRIQPPQAIFQVLQDQYQCTKTTNWALFRELGDLLGIFESEHISVVLLKGAALAKTLYPAIAMRPMNDIDLLIQPSDAIRTQDILIARGFIPYLELAKNYNVQFKHHQAFNRGGKYPMTIEVHWHLFARPYYRNRMPIDWFWQRTEPIDMDGYHALAFTPISQLIHLAAHTVLNHQSDSNFLPLYDLALLLNRYCTRINWDEVIQSAQTFGLSHILQSTLDHVEEIWNIALPDNVSSRLEQSISIGERVLFMINVAPLPQVGYLWDGLNQPGIRKRLKYFWHTLFPSRSYMQKRYELFDARSILIFYTRRLVREIGRFVRSLVSIAGNVY
jgi:hypothetical protein